MHLYPNSNSPLTIFVNSLLVIIVGFLVAMSVGQREDGRNDADDIDDEDDRFDQPTLDDIKNLTTKNSLALE